jgi:heterotetrameric sarcosine oxidase gamma subunit
MPDARPPVARTPLHHWHAAHGARFTDRDGWQVVAAYGGAEREAEAPRAGLALADVSAFAKVSLRGPGVSALVERLAPALAGTALACRLTQDHVLVLSNGSQLSTISYQPDRAGDGGRVIRTDVTSAYAGFAVVGPLWEELLRKLTHLDLRPASFPVNSCAETALAGVEALLVRTGELSVPSVRVYVAWDLAGYVWERLIEAGRDLAITPLGLDALALLRREARDSPLSG